MKQKKRKMRFELGDNESIDQCLERMKKEGYEPIGKIEKPVFQEVFDTEGNSSVKPVKQQIIFEGRLIE
ncbi:NETI motif-containing protein [Caldibacillus lycopersici]|uniref:NETI motif-containing protein n=1 Tax=Perspicuibacillus lycopersici TaxID=1325689 RepID=A0AAE3IVS8_9BACI|nr:NETI motif-containing protein [Perspicuibacillus lycopersici]MCU9614299.1 NETI motif-containing protein [Perspicuibacillus lycopersici]